MRQIIDDSFRLAKVTTRSGVAGRFLVFSAVGAVGATAHYLVLIWAHKSLNIDPVIASALGAIAGAFVNYLLNYYVTFDVMLPHESVMPKFYLIAAVGFLLNILIMWQMVHHFGIHYIWSQLVATVVVLIWGFIGNSVWTFKKTT
jgi:putative flippase GtrA